jgi:hypothetical protein
MEIKDIFFTFFLSFIGHFLFAQEDTTSIRLYGNKNCQTQIEEIALTYTSITVATYEPIKGRLYVQYIGDFNKDSFVFHFASKGYDAENIRTKDVLYNALSEQCKYIRKKDEVVRD